MINAEAKRLVLYYWFHSLCDTCEDDIEFGDCWCDDVKDAIRVLTEPDDAN